MTYTNLFHIPLLKISKQQMNRVIEVGTISERDANSVTATNESWLNPILRRDSGFKTQEKKGFQVLTP